MAGSISLMIPGTVTDLIGVALLAAGIVLRKVLRWHAPKKAEADEQADDTATVDSAADRKE